jgi:hypothetical protein
MVIMVDSRAGSFIPLLNSNEKEIINAMPQIKATLDKNKSQRIGILV